LEETGSLFNPKTDGMGIIGRGGNEPKGTRNDCAKKTGANSSEKSKPYVMARFFQCVCAQEIAEMTVPYFGSQVEEVENTRVSGFCGVRG
jgi:hypothetical protein